MKGSCHRSVGDFPRPQPRNPVVTQSSHRSGKAADRRAGMHRSEVERVVPNALFGSVRHPTRAGFDVMDRCWAIGDKAWKQDMVARFRQEGAAEPTCGPERDALRAERWQRTLTQALIRISRTPEDLRAARKGADWKVALAADLKSTCGANYRWLAEQLSMGNSDSVRHHVGHWRRLRHQNGGATARASAE